MLSLQAAAAFCPAPFHAVHGKHSLVSAVALENVVGSTLLAYMVGADGHKAPEALAGDVRPLSGLFVEASAAFLPTACQAARARLRLSPAIANAAPYNARFLLSAKGLDGDKTTETLT